MKKALTLKYYMNIKKVKFHHLLVFIFLFPVINITAQIKSIQSKNFLTDFVFKGNHIRFNFSTISDFKARLKKISGIHPVTSTATPGLLLSFMYQINFDNSYSLLTGIEMTLIGRNLITSFNKNDFSPALIKDYKIRNKDTYVPDLILSLPVLFEKRMLYSDTKYVFIDAGVSFNLSTGADLDIFSIYLTNTNNGFYNAGEINVNANNNARPWLSFPINLGHSWLLKNNNLLQLSICYNLSFTKYVNGTYLIDIPGQQLTEGKYSSTGSCIGLSFSYSFTNSNYRIRTAYEKIKNQ